jgi:DNA-binding transcriptional regulator GbsR (MarR family)
MSNEAAPIGKFVDAFGELGAAWGLPRDACRVHALLYLSPGGCGRGHIAEALELSPADVSGALSFLCDYQLAWTQDEDVFSAHDDPWDALLTGLAQRRARDLPAMRATLMACREEAAITGNGAAFEVAQINKMIDLVSDLSALHAQAFRFPSRFLRGMIGLSGRAARLFSNRID